jgi:predicted ATP-dependent endonuclease of OLD family
MYVKTLIISNYKSCRLIQLDLFKDEPTIFIGINDCGKSTILKALGLLLDDKPDYHFEKENNKRNDLSHHSLSQEELQKALSEYGLPPLDYHLAQTIILGKLVLEERDLEYINTNGCSDHLLWVLDNLEDEEKGVWIARVFDVGDSSVSDYLLTLDNKGGEELFNQNQANLKKIQKTRGVSDQDVENENRKGPFKNIERARAIYAREELQYTWCKYKIKPDKPLFPTYRYLDWNISITDLEDYTKEVLQKEIQDHLDQVRKTADQESANAQKKVNQELAEISREITADIPEVEGLEANIHFEIKTQVTDFLVKKVYSSEAVHINSQGEGMQRQIWFGLLRWKARRDAQNQNVAKDFIWCFDEPETHLYPKAQREFFSLIQQVSKQNIQTLLSTHSSIFIDRAQIGAINQVELQEGYSFYSKCSQVEDVFNALQIKNSDFLFYDKFLMVEGDTEAVLIPHVYKLYSGGRTLYDDGIQIVKLGGSGKREQNKRILDSLLKDFQKTQNRIVYIFDNDVHLSGTFKDTNAKVFYIGRQDMEDSICSGVWATFYNSILNPHVEITDADIDRIKSEIPNDRTINATEKFFPKLSKFVVERVKGTENKAELFRKLPSDKGTNISSQLSEYITALDQVDSNMIAAFDQLLRE